MGGDRRSVPLTPLVQTISAAPPLRFLSDLSDLRLAGRQPTAVPVTLRAVGPPLHDMVKVFEVGQLVRVADRQWPGVNKEGGDARVVRVHNDGNVAVKYIINNRSESSVHVKVR